MNRGQLNSPFNLKSPDANWRKQNEEGLRNSMSPDFIPFDYSSPLSSMKRRNIVNKPYNKGVMRLYDNSSSPSSNTSLNSFSPNSSSNSFGSSNSNVSGYFNNRSNNFNRFKNQKFCGKTDSRYSNYFHSSMLDDPWEKLEMELLEQVGAENMKLVSNNCGSKSNEDSFIDNSNSTAIINSSS